MILLSLLLYLLLEPAGVVRLLLFGLFLLGLWWLLEYIEFKEERTGLLADILERKFDYLLAVVVSSLLIGLFVEGLNRLIPGWQYKNIPFSSIHFLNIPIIILIGWFPLIVILLSFYRSFIRGKQEVF